MSVFFLLVIFLVELKFRQSVSLLIKATLSKYLFHSGAVHNQDLGYRHFIKFLSVHVLFPLQLIYLLLIFLLSSSLCLVWFEQAYLLAHAVCWVEQLAGATIAILTNKSSSITGLKKRATWLKCVAWT